MDHRREGVSTPRGRQEHFQAGVPEEIGRNAAWRLRADVLHRHEPGLVDDD